MMYALCTDIFILYNTQGGPKICVKNVEAGRGDLNKQIACKNTFFITRRFKISNNAMVNCNNAILPLRIYIYDIDHFIRKSLVILDIF